MGIVVLMFLVCSLRTNLVFVGIFFVLDVALFTLTGAYWRASHGDIESFHKLEVVGFLPSEFA